MQSPSLVILFVLSAVGIVSAQTYSASFTLYGSRFGDPNCNSALNTACGFYTYPGYSAAVSQNLYGASSGASGACQTCYYATVNRDVNDYSFGSEQSIVIMVDNLCPATSAHCSNGYPCEGGAPGSCNDWGMDVNVDLCDDSGAGAALLEPYGVGAAKGWITATDCSAWYNAPPYGQVKYDAGSG